MSFNPPQFPAADATYQYGNITWRFDGTAGVWNIVDASLVGAQGPVGPQGPKGDKGETGEKGDTGQPATGDSASIIVSNGFITARLGAVGSTGVLGVSNRFSVVNGIAHPLPASNGESGIASFDSAFFTVSGTGHVSLSGIGSLNRGVTSFNGLTGAVTLTGDGGAIVGRGNNTIGARLATTGVTGVSRFASRNFTVTNGLVEILGSSISNDLLTNDSISIVTPTGSGLVGGKGVTLGGSVTMVNVGVTGISVNGGTGATGTVNLVDGSNISITRNGNNITVSGEDPGSTIKASPQQVLFAEVGGKGAIEGTGSSNFLFDGASATFAGSSFNLANTTTVRGGVFFDAAESGSFTNFGSGSIAINATGGNVQRIRINPSGTYTVDVGAAWASGVSGVAESVVVIMQSVNGRTGAFADNILTSLPKPVLGGVTGGIDVFTMMCVGNGSSTTLKMAFQIAKGMTGTDPDFTVGTF